MNLKSSPYFPTILAQVTCGSGLMVHGFISKRYLFQYKRVEFFQYGLYREKTIV